MPVAGAPPAVGDDAKKDILEAANADPTGQHTGGKDDGDKNQPKKEKTAKELEKERKKAEKDAKFKAKKAAQAAASTGKEGKAGKEKKPKAEKEVLPDYIEETKPGEKKVLRSFEDPHFKAYVPKAVESAWYDWWEKEGYFKPDLKPDGTVKDAGNVSHATSPV